MVEQGDLKQMKTRPFEAILKKPGAVFRIVRMLKRLFRNFKPPSLRLVFLY